MNFRKVKTNTLGIGLPANNMTKLGVIAGSIHAIQANYTNGGKFAMGSPELLGIAMRDLFIVGDDLEAFIYELLGEAGTLEVEKFKRLIKTCVRGGFSKLDWKDEKWGEINDCLKQADRLIELIDQEIGSIFNATEQREEEKSTSDDKEVPEGTQA